MTATQVLGAALVAACFLFLYGMTASVTGWRIASVIWGFAVTMTAVIALGAALATGAAA